MIELTGTIVNTFATPAGKNKKGEDYDSKDKIQVIGEFPMPNGEVRMELVTLTVDDLSEYIQLINKKIRISVGVMATGARSVLFFVRKGSSPVLAN
jgi:tetrahydromethanopterin S-methyltransferase subunit F